MLHNIAAKKEVLGWGVFRTGGVTIAGTPWIPTAHDKLPALFANMIEEAQNIPDIYDRAIFIFLEMARNQFFYDVNKRMGRLMMNALLLLCSLAEYIRGTTEQLLLPRADLIGMHIELCLLYTSPSPRD